MNEEFNNFDIKIADLGCAVQFDSKKGLDTVLGTPLYMAPELVKEQKYNEKVDVWSLGCIVYQLLSGKTPFDGKSIQQINRFICTKEVSFKEKQWANVSPGAKDFIMQCLDRNQTTRPSVEELFEHPWICDNQDYNSSTNKTEQLTIAKNLTRYLECSELQRTVLNLISGLSTGKDEIEKLQKEFIKLDSDRSGTLSMQELKKMARANKNGDQDWNFIFEEIDQNGDGVIDFEEFLQAFIDKKVLTEEKQVKMAFNLLDYNKDGTISLDDFDDLFNSYGGARMDRDMWYSLLGEADKNGDGVVSFPEFKEAMGALLKSGLSTTRKGL